jgi:hypothetical protein
MIGSPVSCLGRLQQGGRGRGQGGGPRGAQRDRQGPARRPWIPSLNSNLVVVSALGGRPTGAKPASDGAAKAEARDAGQDDVEADRRANANRSVSPGW